MVRMALCNVVKAKRGKKTKQKKQNKTKQKFLWKEEKALPRTRRFRIIHCQKFTRSKKKETFQMISNSRNLYTSSPRQLHRFETKHSVDLKRMPKNLRNNTFTDVGHLSTSSTLLFTRNTRKQRAVASFRRRTEIIFRELKLITAWNKY